MFQDLSTHHDWSVKKGIFGLPIRMKGNSKRFSGNSSSPLAAQNKDLGAAALQKLLTGVKLRLQAVMQRLQAVSFILPLCFFRPLFNSDNELDNSEATSIYKQVRRCFSYFSHIFFFLECDHVIFFLCALVVGEVYRLSANV